MIEGGVELVRLSLRSQALPSPPCCVLELTPEVTEEERNHEALMKLCARSCSATLSSCGATAPHTWTTSHQANIEGEGVRTCDRLWGFVFIPLAQSAGSLHRDLPSFFFKRKKIIFWNITRLLRRQRIVTAPCEQERRALCHAEPLSVPAAGYHRCGRTPPAMPRLERRRSSSAAHQLLQQVPGQPGGGRALLQEVRGGERCLSRRLLPADSVPVQRERPEAAAHLAGGPLGQQLRLPVWCAHLHHQQPRKGFLLRIFQQGHLSRRHRTPRGHRWSAGDAAVRWMRDVPLSQVWSGQGQGPADRGPGHFLLCGFQPRWAEGGQKLEAEQKAHRVHTCGLFHDFGHHCVECCCSHMAGPDHCRISAQWDGTEETEMT